MKAFLSSEVFLKNNLTDEEVFYLLLLFNNCNIERAQKALITKGFITQDGNLFKEYRITPSGNKALSAVLLDSDPNVPTKGKSISQLAEEMRELFPKGMQQGKYSWRDSTTVIVERLRGFFKKFGEYPYEDIVQATKNYVNRMDGDPYMKVLKYFIWNTQKGPIESPLAAELAVLKEGDENTSEDWRTNII